MTELASYGPFAIGALGALVVVIAVSIASKGSGRGSAASLALPRDRLLGAAVSYVGAFVLFVAIDVASGQAITRFAQDRTNGLVILGITIGALIGAVLVLSRRRSSARP